MNRRLTDFSLHELWELFPIFLTEHQACWHQWFLEEKAALFRVLCDVTVIDIHHIGSTAVSGIWAKPIVDVLVVLPDEPALVSARDRLTAHGYLQMSATPVRIALNKGYTETGFAEKVFHVHLRVQHDTDEVLFRDYLRAHPDTAKAYEELKLELWRQFEHDRDRYTAGKTEFVETYTELARRQSACAAPDRTLRR